jgi:hypothetical protein
MNTEKKKATMKREPERPFYWLLTDNETGALIDRDKYQNDLIPRWEHFYQIEKVGT